MTDFHSHFITVDVSRMTLQFALMEISDETLLVMYHLDPINVPTTMIGRALKLLGPDDQKRLKASVTRRRPRNERERQILLHYALSENRGGILFVDTLGGFDKQYPC